MAYRGVVISYRSGTRYNPDEQALETATDHSLDPKLSKDNTKRKKRKDSKSKPRTKQEKEAKENVDPDNGAQIGEKSKSSDLDTETLKGMIDRHSEGKTGLTSELQIVSEVGGSKESQNLKEKPNININVDDYAETGAIPKRSSEK